MRKRLVAEPSKQGRRPERQFHATRLVVDDFGDAVAYEFRCASCWRWGGSSIRGWCRECKMWSERQRRAALDEEGLEALRAMRREQRRRRLAENPEAARQERERTERARQARLVRDEVREKALQAARARRYAERLRGDPERYRERLEKMRIDNGLRRMRQGLPVGVITRRKVRGTYADSVPAAPLGMALVQASGETDLETVCGLAGVPSRTVRAWRSGALPKARFATADQVLVALGRNWWDVYDPVANGDLFSGQHGRNVTAWCEAMLSAAEAWEGV